MAQLHLQLNTFAITTLPISDTYNNGYTFHNYTCYRL